MAGGAAVEEQRVLKNVPGRKIHNTGTGGGIVPSCNQNGQSDSRIIYITAQAVVRVS